uniref:restriction endonuclease subunit S n=1 Tax=uncultured Dysgonomonas sp. TaxID=206096 RepID=UPI00258E674C|nr:restriction endonuclease subunit S [uncultured Dysgonomonas sp.]
MKDKWRITEIGKILKPSKNVEIVNPEKDYTLLGMSLEGRGLFVRETKKGGEIGSKTLNKIIPGEFIYSRLFAWKGAFDYVRDEFENTYVSNEYPTFIVDSQMADVKFLYYYFNQAKIWKEVEQYCIGVTKASRNRFKEEYFLNFPISIPSIESQRDIVSKIEYIKKKIGDIQNIRETQKKEIQQLLYSKYLEIIHGASLFPMHDIAPIIRRPVIIKNEEIYPELGIRSFGKGTFHKPSITGIEVGTKKIFQIKKGDLLFSNVFAWEGAIAVAKKEDDLRYGSHRFISCLTNDEKVLPEFLCYHFLTEKGLEIINVSSPGGAGRNKTLGLEKLMNIQVPVPSIEDQSEFISLLEKIKKIEGIHKRQDDELVDFNKSLFNITFEGKL